jgi:3-deoxy-D-manno-octulosonic-acid transferase
MTDGEARATIDDMAGRARRAKVHLALLSVLIVVASPIILIGKAISFLRRRPLRHYDPLRWLGKTHGPRQTSAGDGVVKVVYVAASFGEAAMGERFHTRLAAMQPGIQAAWTIRNRLEFDYLCQANPERRYALWPFDFYFPVKKWMDDMEPDVVVLLEKFWFGNLALAAAARGARVVVLNGRTNPQASWFKRLVSPHYGWILQAFETLCLQSDAYRELLRPMLPRSLRTVVAGNIKLDLPLPEPAPEKLESLKSWLTSGPSQLILVAGSTDSLDEDRFVTDAFLEARKVTPCTLLIAPRRLVRCDSIVEYWQSLGLVSSRRSNPTADAEVLLLDTLGELAHVYGMSAGAFIGGTLIGAGHNIIEPLQSGIPVAYGPCRDHFEELQLRCEAAGVGFRVTKPGELASHWVQILGDPAVRDDLRLRAQEMLAVDRGAFDANLKALAEAVEAVLAQREAHRALGNASSDGAKA